MCLHENWRLKKRNIGNCNAIVLKKIKCLQAKSKRQKTIKRTEDEQIERNVLKKKLQSKKKYSIHCK